jgi:ATP-dependent DNA helicase RecG
VALYRDTVQMGIQKVFRIQKERYFPMPDYDISDSQKVVVKVYGKVLDENYSRVLFAHPEFDLETVFLIDKVQKHIPIYKEQLKLLRSLGVVEGRMPNIYVSAQIAESIDKKAQYIRNIVHNDDYLKTMILEHLKTFGSGKKNDFMKLILPELPESLDGKQQGYKVSNLLKALKNEGLIQTDASKGKSAEWFLTG